VRGLSPICDCPALQGEKIRIIATANLHRLRLTGTLLSHLDAPLQTR
jgi:hypothetical protein